MKILKIKKITLESPDIKTFTFEHQLKAEPGQFVMLWIPGTDQKPISISRQTDQEFDLTVYKVGPATTKLFEYKEGDKLGIEGPYGRGFTVEANSKIILVGGGCGTAPLRFLGEYAQQQGCEVNLITGSRDSKNIFFDKIFSNTCIMTDDGSLGEKGFPTVKLEEKLKQGGIDQVYTCGPEKMMVGVVNLCSQYNIPCQISLERYMKCGFGICGQCSLDPIGLCVCKDGPVFSGEQAAKISEFGKYHRDKSGIKKDL